MSLPTLGVSLLLLAVGLAASAYLYRWNTKVSDQLDRRVASVLASEELLLSVRDVRNELDRYVGSRSEDSLRAARAASDTSRRLIVRLKHGEHDAELLGEATSCIDADAAFMRHADSAGPERLDSALDSMRQRSVPAAAALLAANRELLAEDSAENRRLSRRFGTGLAFLAVCGSAAGLLAGLGVARGVVNSIQALGGSVRSMSESLSDGKVSARPTGELRELLHAMTEVQEKTEGIVSELQRSRETAQRADQLAAVGQLAAGIAHELRNPLTAIKLLADGACEQQSAMDAVEVAVIREEATRMHEMLQTFLDFARPPRLERETVDLVEVTRQSVEFVRPKAERVGIDVNLRVDVEDAIRSADRQQLRQVLLNLLINAVEAQPDGGRIDVSIRESETGSVEIEVADDGPGIPCPVLETLFEPFVSSKETGVGLGLAISRRIAASHGGSLTGQNQERGGALFRLELPTGTEIVSPDVRS